MCSGSEAGSYLRLKDFVHHSTLGLRVIRKKKKNLGDENVVEKRGVVQPCPSDRVRAVRLLALALACAAVPRRARI